ncbi:MAG: type IV secretion system DNA-binding domain-containing protein [Patescibacteria group bacterium]|nr:type IV secretion system DNA-binding domain-containing protein [Patescibacteria group bacterium]
MSIEYNHDHENEITLFAETNFRNQRRRFGIKTDDRRKHVYIIGKTGMGKTVLQENMIMSDIMAGHGVCYIDPHGDTAEKLLDYIPSNRINDVVYFNPADVDFPVGFNILETIGDSQKHLAASGLMGVFKKIWPDVWSARMEYILLNCVLALLDYPGATLLGINRLLVDVDYRTRVIAKIRDPIVKTFWVAEFSSWEVKYQTEAIAPIQNKVGQFLSASIIRNIVSQVKSTIDLRDIMDTGKIFIVNLSKGRIGEENMKLLGGMIISRIQMAAMERVDLPEEDRRDFYLFVDEFQNFANESFASILSEARKYRLALTVAHQYIEQLTEEVRAAVIGNAGTILAFRIGGTDASFLEQEFSPVFTPEDLVNLTKYTIYLKLMVDGVATAPFSATTLPPMATFTGNAQKVISVSRERYAVPRSNIEEKVLRWSGMEAAATLKVAAEEIQEAKDKLGGITASMLEAGLQEAGRRAETPKEEVEHRAPLLQGMSQENLDKRDEHEAVVEYLKISPERLKAIAKPPSSGKKEKPKFTHTCNRCGKVWDMPIQLDPSRPIYCAECMPIVREERNSKGKASKMSPVPEIRGSVRVVESNKDAKAGQPPAAPNRPRVVGDLALAETPKPQKAPEVKAVHQPTPPSRPPATGLMAELERIKGRALETSKAKVERKMDNRPAVNDNRPQTPRDKIQVTNKPLLQKSVDVSDVVKKVEEEEETTEVPRTLTIFKQATPQNKTLRPGQRITF